MRVWVILCCVWLLGGAAWSAPRGRAAVLPVTHWRAANGMPVYWVPRHDAPLWHVRVVWAGGSVYDGDKPGVAGLANAFWGEETETQTGQEVGDAFDQVGALFGHAVDREKAQLDLTALSDPRYARPALSQFLRVITTRSMHIETFSRLKKQLATYFDYGSEQPSVRAERAMYSMIYPSSPYAHSPAVGRSALAAISGQAMLRFIRQYYVRENGAILMVGDLSVDQAHAIANAIAHAIPGGARATRPAAPAPLAGNDLFQHISMQTTQTTINLACQSIGRHVKNPAPWAVANYILGGMPLGSVLFNAIRAQQGLAYDVSSALTRFDESGLLSIRLKTRADQASHALALVQKTRRDFIRNGPSSAQLASAKASLIKRFPFALMGADQQMEALTQLVFYDYPLDYYDHYVDRVQAVTVSAVREAIASTWREAPWAVVTVGPTAPVHG